MGVLIDSIPSHARIDQPTANIHTCPTQAASHPAPPRPSAHAGPGPHRRRPADSSVVAAGAGASAAAASLGAEEEEAAGPPSPPAAPEAPAAPAPAAGASWAGRCPRRWRWGAGSRGRRIRAGGGRLCHPYPPAHQAGAEDGGLGRAAGRGRCHRRGLRTRQGCRQARRGRCRTICRVGGE